MNRIDPDAGYPEWMRRARQDARCRRVVARMLAGVERDEPEDDDRPRRDPYAEHRLSYAQLLGSR